MKTIKLLILFIILIGTILPSCKKGENDPFLTLRTRKARITGIWKLKSGITTYTYNDTTQTVNYNGINADIVYTITNYGTIASGNLPYTEIWTMNKDYSFKMVKNYFDRTITLNGFWSFYYKDKSIDLKNKEAIIFRVTSKKYIDNNNIFNNYDNSYTGTYCPTYLYFIDQLKNKEIIMKYEGSSIWTDLSENGTGLLTFIQEKK